MPKILDFKVNAERRLKILNKSSTKAEIVLYAGIGQDYWGDGSMISAKQFSDELKKLDSSVKEIDLRINSPGGDVFDGIAIYNRLISHPARINVYIDGLAASIASIIA
jgi:ATP-dependent Clp protease protease subunit